MSGKALLAVVVLSGIYLLFIHVAVPKRGPNAPASRNAPAPSDPILRGNEKKKFLAEVERDMKRAAILPQGLSLSISDCKETNAYYYHDRKIVLCYGLVDEMYGHFFREYRSVNEAKQATRRAASFIMFHELGHALVNTSDIALTAGEEPSVDQLAFFLLTRDDQSRKGEEAIIEAANFFFKVANAGETSAGDAHGFHQQRAFNLTCWLFGQGKDFSHIKASLPPDRAATCKGEYDQLEKSWGKVLTSHRLLSVSTKPGGLQAKAR